MDKLYRLVKAEGFAFSAFGVRIGIRISTAGWLERIKTHLPPGSRVQMSPTVGRVYSFVIGVHPRRPGIWHFNFIYANSELIARSVDERQLLTAFESDVGRYVAQISRSRLFVHAGVVGWNGKAIIIAGRSCSGKTWLVRELLRQGAAYYSDEYALFDGRGYIHPFARPLSVRDEDTQLQNRVYPEELGSSTGIKPLPVGLIVFTRYRCSAHWRPQKISPGKAILHLLANSLSARQQPRRALTILQRALRSAQILKGVRGEAGDVARNILDISCRD
jgi:hypothetical protein